MSVYLESNLNPRHRRVGDCVIRALSAALGQTWDQTFVGVCLKGFENKDMPSSNSIWGAYLRDKGFARHIVLHDSADIYTVEDFTRDHPRGTYILGLDNHVVCVKDGVLLDSWNSSEETPIFYWTKKEGA